MQIKTTRGWMPLLVACTNSNDLQGVFKAQDLEEVRAELAPRVERFCKDLVEYHPINNASKFRAKHYAEKLIGAFGETL